MRSLAKLAFVCLFVSVCSSCHRNNIPWNKFTSTQGAFSITMPAPVKVVDKKGLSIFGKNTPTHISYWEPSSLTIDKFKRFEVSYTDVPANIGRDSLSMAAILDSAIITRRRDFTDKEPLIQNIELNGYPGRAFFFDGGGNTLLNVKVCFANDRLYEFMVESKKNYATNNEVSTFYNSFVSIKQ